MRFYYVKLRLAKEPQTIQTEIATGNQPAKANPKSDSDRPLQSRVSSWPSSGSL